MAALDNPHNVKSSIATEMKSSNQTVIVWDLLLESSSDTLIVPALYTTYNPVTLAVIKTGLASSLTTGITTTPGTNDEGSYTVAITGGSKGQRIMLATLHQKGLKGNLNRDEDPT